MAPRKKRTTPGQRVERAQKKISELVGRGVKMNFAKASLYTQTERKKYVSGLLSGGKKKKKKK